MKKRSTARFVFKVFSFVLLLSLLVSRSYTQEPVAVYAQDAYTATPTSSPAVENTPEPADQPDAATTEPGSVVDEQQTRPGQMETQDQVNEPGIPTDRIIVKYKSEMDALSSSEQASQMERASSAAGQSLNYLRAMSDNSHVLQLRERLPLEQVQSISEQLMLLPEVEYAEPDAIMRPALTPNDAQYGSQWHYFGTWGINAPAAWDITTGSSNIVMAVIDTGITNHSDLSGRTVPGYDFISNAWVANDGNGRDSNPSDPGDWVAFGDCGFGVPAEASSWHGTHVAGTMGAASNNGTGVAGVNWNSKILPVRVLGRCGGYLSDIADGMRWAAGLSVSGVPRNPNPAKVLNLSLGATGACGTTYQSAINNVLSAGSVIVVAAGNEAAPASSSRPGNCNGVITVAATAGDGYRASYSNSGSTVEISAPGGDMPLFDTGVLSTSNTGTAGPVADTYTASNGTSMAAPHVSGIVSLMFSINPKLTPAQVLQILQSTARPFLIDPTNDFDCDTSICGAGIVDAGAAVSAVPPAIPGVPGLLSPASGVLVDTVQPVLDWKDSYPVAHHYQIQVATNNTFTALVIDRSDILLSTFMPTTELTPGRLYYWRVKAFNAIGGASGWSTVRNFKTPLAQAILLTPASSELLTIDRPTFDWNPVDGAAQYNLQVSAAGNFSTLLVNVTVAATEYTMTKDLPQNKTLYWRVRAKTSALVGPWSTKWNFKTGNPPTVPVLAAPANNALVKDYTPVLNWNNSTVPAGTTLKHYELQVDDQNDFSSPVIGTTSTVSQFIPLSDLASNTKFYWRVRAVNTVTLTSIDHTSGWSAVRSFRTIIPAPTGLLMTPDPGNPLKPSFSWDAATGVISGYTIQISATSNFSTLIVNSTTQNPFYTMAKNLPAHKTIYWRVRVKGANGPSAWSKTQFTTP